MHKKIIGVTGHRTLFHDPKSITECFINLLKPHDDVIILVGMAAGYDQLVAEICLAANIKYIAAVPFEGQEKLWPKATQERYHELLKKADKVHIVSPGGYAPWKMQVRNIWIVDNSESLLAYFDGNHAKGSGTGLCVRYAEKKKKPIINVYSQTSLLTV